jgi:uncharacterized RDD family membrane protein YckC
MPFQNPTASQKTFSLAFCRKSLRLACLGFVGLSFAPEYVFDIPLVGDSIASKNGSVSVSAGSHPAVLLWATAALVIFVVLMLRGTRTVTAAVPKLRRRISAFLIDFWFSLTMLSAIWALIPLCLEANRTGKFQWYFKRDYLVSTDNQFVIPGVFAYMALMFLYFAFPLIRGKQTVGCFIMRLQVLPPFGDRGRFTLRQALRRTFYEFFGLSNVLFGGWKVDSEGRTWCDRETNCSVVLLDENAPELGPTE